MTKEDKKQLCAGCYNDEYNQGLGGANECFYFKKARVCKKKEVHIDDVPPWKHQRIFKTLTCYRKPRFVYIDPERTY